MTDVSELDLVAEARRNWAERGLIGLDAMVAATSLARAHQIVLGRINASLHEYGLTFSRYEALALLSFTHSGSMAMARMGERLQVHPTSVTSTIDRLERDGLVSRAPHPDDRRATLATLTAEGRALLDQTTAVLESINWGLEGVDDSSTGDLITSLASIRAAGGDVTSQGDE